MLAEATTEIDGREVSLKITLGALEQIAKVNPRIGELQAALSMKPTFELDELKVVIAAGLKAAEETTSAREVIEAMGLTPARNLALRLLNEADRDDSGNSKGGGSQEPTGARRRFKSAAT